MARIGTQSEIGRPIVWKPIYWPPGGVNAHIEGWGGLTGGDNGYISDDEDFGV